MRFSGSYLVLVVLPAFFWIALVPERAVAQVANPADAARSSEEEGNGLGPPPRLRSWEMPAITVAGEPASTLKEEERIGSYGQPRWTATRRFPTTRVYVVPEGKIEAEYWMRVTVPKDGPSSIRTLYEIELGLPYRFQFDLYYRTDQTGDEGEKLIAEQFEVRYALADWGVIAGNPTLYFEYIMKEQEPDVVEPKLLFGGEISPRWHWGTNFVAELETGGSRENEYQMTNGVSYTIQDSKFSLGIESKFTIADTKEDRGNFQENWFLGPSLQLRPTQAVTMNVAPLLGLTGGDASRAQLFFNIGVEF